MSARRSGHGGDPAQHHGVVVDRGEADRSPAGLVRVDRHRSSTSAPGHARRRDVQHRLGAGGDKRSAIGQPARLSDVSHTAEPTRVVVVGAGFGGIAAAIELTARGETDVTVLESAPDLGGTWHHNVYPGAACDVPSHFYSFSFAQRASWSRFCSPQSEILGYLREVAREHGVDRLVVTDQQVTACTWDEESAVWTVDATAADGTTTRRTADAVVIATGQLDKPAYPRIEGLDRFAGRTLHSARWDPDLDPAGKRFAVIGTGATSAQLVPELAPAAEHTTVFQRSGNWYLPRRSKDYSTPVRVLLARVPGLHRIFRALLAVYLETLTAAIRHPRTLGRVLATWSTLFMRGQLKDPDVRRTAWPDYTFGCRRVLFSSSYLPALQRPDVSLVGEAITEMTERGPRTADGRVHEVDVVVLATGFRTTDFMFPMEVVGTGGRRLRDDWAEGPRAHLGMTVPGYPNLFLLYGPNTNTSGGSIVFFLEHQARYVRQALELSRGRRAALDVRPEVAGSSDAALQSRFSGTAWTACDSWYRDESGRIVANWPGYMREYADATREAHVVAAHPAGRPGVAQRQERAAYALARQPRPLGDAARGRVLGAVVELDARRPGPAGSGQPGDREPQRRARDAPPALGRVHEVADVGDPERLGQVEPPGHRAEEAVVLPVGDDKRPRPAVGQRAAGRRDPLQHVLDAGRRVHEGGQAEGQLHRVVGRLEPGRRVLAGGGAQARTGRWKEALHGSRLGSPDGGISHPPVVLVVRTRSTLSAVATPTKPAPALVKNPRSTRSTIALKLTMATSGTIFILFVLLHMYGNLKAFAGHDAFNEYAEHLRTFGEPILPRSGLLWIVRVVLIASLAVHVASAVALWRRASHARPVRYANRRYRNSALSSRTMRWGGLTILVFLVWHLLNFSIGRVNPSGGPTSDPYNLLVDTFDLWWMTVIYLVAMAALGMHLHHGTWSAAQTLGLTGTAQARARAKALGWVLAIVIAGGFSLVPIFTVVGVITK
ncbi:hypothetical protein LUZ63_020162 [Rhynchospora breviuscula]|uniref:Flavin-containing monooxygenase n=1 Tax=Rhynchospora breviuscula TaxID=2022672 RepID=A0A9Q0C0X3_9POAL|nr:hypothetical protein LUZ63_020162 [Rhynchospora breviuscula]